MAVFIVLLLLVPLEALLWRQCSSMKEMFILPGDGTTIHSMREDFFFLCGSERDAITDHIVLAGVINLALPINLLDGLRWGGRYL